MPRQKILFAASEVYPFAKSGGLADVAHSLPRALSERHDVTVVMPLYGWIDKKNFGIRKRSDIIVQMGGKTYDVSLYGCTTDGVRHLFVYASLLCDRDFLYGPPDKGYEDNALRFGLFSHAVVQLAKTLGSDVVHLNDWQTALTALLIAEDSSCAAKTVYTIHNLAYQGVFEAAVLPRLDIAARHFTMEGVEFYGSLNLMKAGIRFADAVTTVSPTYAKEILSAEFGCGLEGYLFEHRAKLYGITNGIDTEHFSPSTDNALYRTYKTPRGKTYNKARYLDSAGLSDPLLPLFIFIGRFTWQKGMDVLIESLPAMAGRTCNIAILGEGESLYREGLEKAAEAFANVHLFFGYDEGLAHRMYAAADFLMMPSRFEPCGLNQLIAMHYGAIPIVRSVGGLADTVTPLQACETSGEMGCGIVFEGADAGAFMDAFEAAMALYGDAAYPKTAAKNMKADVSWRRSAAAYGELYRKISERTVK